MTDQLAIALLAVSDEGGIVLRSEGVHRHRSWDGVPGEHIEDAKHTDPVAVLAMSKTGIVGKRPRPQSAGQRGRLQGAGRGLPLLVIETQEHADRHRCVIGPAQHAAGRQRRPIIVLVIHSVAALGRHHHAPRVHSQP